MDNHSGKSGNFPGKWELKKAEVIRGADSLEITKLVSEFNVYASIIDPTIVGELLVIDGRNVLSGLPVQGGDLVKLSIDITGEIREYTLRIAQIKNISDLETQRMYIIQCVSNLFFESFHHKLSQSFEGPLNDIAFKIYEKYTDEPFGIFEASKGSETIIIPNWNPIKALTWLAARAESLEQQVRFRFFQDTKGFYNFMPIEKALTNYKDNPPFEFVYRGNASGDKDFFAIKNLVFNPASYDLGKALREGYLKGRAFDINISKKTLGIVDYDYFKEFDKKDYLNDYPSYYKQDFGVGKIKMDLSTAGSKKTNVSDLKRTSVTDYNQMVQITIFGNSEIDVGQVVELDIPNPDPGNNKEQDKLWAGKYYVIGKRDLYTGDNCSMVLDCAKESMGIEL
tara:strand:+ start:33649 stop:34836 length:1188 start_codon:yes stop_codon:yes gene_type:complete